MLAPLATHCDPFHCCARVVFWIVTVKQVDCSNVRPPVTCDGLWFTGHVEPLTGELIEAPLFTGWYVMVLALVVAVLPALSVTLSVTL